MKKIILLFVFTVFVSCSNDDNSDVTPIENNIELKENVKVIESEKLILVSDAVQLSNGVYKFTFSGEAPEVNIGDVIVGDQEGGFIRKVTGLEIEGNYLVLQTEQGRMEDVFKSGSFDFTMDMYDMKNTQSQGFSINISNFLLYQNGPLSLMLDNANVDFDPNWHFDFTFNSQGIQYFEMNAQNATLTGGFTVTLTASQASELVNGSESLLGQPVKKTYTKWVPAVVMGIPVQVPVVVEIEMDIIARYSASASATISSSANFTTDNVLNLGVKYDNGQWIGTNDFSSNSDFNLSEISGNTNMMVNVVIEPKIDIKLYGVVGPYATLSLEEEIKANVAIPSLDWDFNSDVWLDFGLGANAVAFGYTLADFNRHWQTPKLNYNTPYQIEIESGNGQNGAFNEFLNEPLVIKVTDSDGNPEQDVRLVFEVIEGGGSMSSQTVLSNSSGIAQTNWKLGPQGKQIVRATAKKSDGSQLSGSPLTFVAGGDCSGDITISVFSNGLMATAAASGGAPPYTYIWNDGEVTGPVYSNLSQTKNVKVTVTDSNGCMMYRNDMCVGKAANLVAIPCTEQSFKFYLDGNLVATLAPGSVTNVIFAASQAQTMVGETTGVTHNYTSSIGIGQNCLEWITCCPDANTCNPDLCN